MLAWHKALSCLTGAALAAGVFSASARADALERGTVAFNRRDYPRAEQELSPLAMHGNARALGLLGFMYEHGLGVPQAYEAAFDLYCQAAVRGNPFAQAMLGLMYDKGHGVHSDFIQAYKWLDLATAHARGRERDTYARFRDAVASKMSRDEIVVGQQDSASKAVEPRCTSSSKRFNTRRAFDRDESRR